MSHDLVVFDLDGTLVDSLPDIATALNAALANAGLPTHDESAIRWFLGDGAQELVRRAAGPVPSDAAIATLVGDYRARYRTHLTARTRPYAGIVDLLARLTAPLAVLTNKPGPEARAIVDELGLRDRFVEVVGEGDGLPRKPDPTALLALTRRQRASRPLYVGDSVVDAETASRAKVDFVFVEWGYGTAPEGVRRIAHPHEL